MWSLLTWPMVSFSKPCILIFYVVMFSNKKCFLLLILVFANSHALEDLCAFLVILFLF